MIWCAGGFVIGCGDLMQVLGFGGCELVWLIAALAAVWLL